MFTAWAGGLCASDVIHPKENRPRENAVWVLERVSRPPGNEFWVPASWPRDGQVPILRTCPTNFRDALKGSEV